MKLAVNLSMIFTEVPLLERFNLAAQHGFQHVEIQFPYELSIDQIQTQLVQHQLTLCLINVPVGDLMQGGHGLAGIPAQEENFKVAVTQAIEYAAALNVPSVNILAGKKPDDIEYDVCFKTLVKNLKFSCSEFSQHGIQPVFEMINGHDMPNFLIQTVADGLKLIEQVNDPSLKMQFDCYHMTRMNENLIKALDSNLDNIGHIQFADVPGRHEPNTGKINFDEVFQFLNQSTYTGFVAAEYRPSNHSNDSFEWKNKIT